MKLTESLMVDTLSSYDKYKSLSKKMIKSLTNDLLDLFLIYLSKGDEVSLKKIGTLKSSLRKSRKGVNPSTKEFIEIPEQKTVRLKVSKNLKQVLND